MRLRAAFLLLIGAITSSAGAVTAGDVIVRGDVVIPWTSFVAAGVNVFDSQGRAKQAQGPFDPFAPVRNTNTGLYNPTAPVPMRSGEFLAGEQGPPYPRLSKFDATGTHVTIYSLPSDPSVHGITALELFSDQCTVVYTVQFTDSAAMFLDPARLTSIRRFDVCANKALPDLALDPAPLRTPNFVRQLPNRDLLVVTPIEVLRYDAKGKLVTAYPKVLSDFIIGVALTPDGDGFWIVDRYRLVRFDFGPSREPAVSVPAVTIWNQSEPPIPRELWVIGEWRAGLQPPPQPKRRAVPH